MADLVSAIIVLRNSTKCLIALYYPPAALQSSPIDCLPTLCYANPMMVCPILILSEPEFDASGAFMDIHDDILIGGALGHSWTTSTEYSNLTRKSGYAQGNYVCVF